MEGIYVDVREKDEWDAGHIKGAIHCPLSEMKKGNIPDLPTDAVLYLYCAAGNRSQVAKKILLATHPLAQSLSKGYEELLKDMKSTTDRILKKKEAARAKKDHFRKQSRK